MIHLHPQLYQLTVTKPDVQKAGKSTRRPAIYFSHFLSQSLQHFIKSQALKKNIRGSMKRTPGRCGMEALSCMEAQISLIILATLIFFIFFQSKGETGMKWSIQVLLRLTGWRPGFEVFYGQNGYLCIVTEYKNLSKMVKKNKIK